MQRKQSLLSRISALLLVIVLLTTSLSGCFLKKNITNDIFTTKDWVSYRLSQDQSIPEFNVTAFNNVETCFKIYYFEPLADDNTLFNKTKSAFEEFCAHVDKNDKDAVTHALIDCYIYAVGDIYSFYRNPEELADYEEDMGGTFVGIGVSVITNTLENTILVTGTEPDSPAQNAGIQADDYIVAVNGESISEIGAKAAVDKIRGEVGAEVTITVLRGEEEISFTMARAIITEKFVTYDFIENTKIVLIRIKSFKGDDQNNTAIQFRQAIDFAESEGAEGIVFDLRSNPGGYLHLTTDMLSYLIPNNTQIVSFSSNKSSIYSENDRTDKEPLDHVLTLPSVVVCNRSSASAAELFTGAMRDYNKMGILNTVIVGEVTYKKGVMQNTISFNDGSALTLTTARYNPPLGENFHGIGVTPDVLVNENEDFIAVAIDELNKIIAAQIVPQ